MSKYFKPEDFEHHHIKQLTTPEHAANIANAKLQELIESSPVVYGYGVRAMASSMWNMNGPETERGPHTHQARLICIEPLVKEECKHIPRNVLWSVERQYAHIECENCGVELKAEWKEVK